MPQTQQENKEKDNSFKYVIAVLLFLFGIITIATINNYIDALRYIGLTPKERQQIDEQYKKKQLDDEKQRHENCVNFVKSMVQPVKVPAVILYVMIVIIIHYFFNSFTKFRRSFL